MFIEDNLQLTKATQRRLENEMKEAERMGNLRLYKIAWSLLLLHQNRTLAEIAEIMHLSHRTLYEWVRRFILEGFGWLIGLHFRGRGRKPKLTDKQKKKLYNMIVQGPEKAGYDCGGWNSAMIVELIQKHFNVTYNPRYVCAMLAIALTGTEPALLM